MAEKKVRIVKVKDGRSVSLHPSLAERLVARGTYQYEAMADRPAAMKPRRRKKGTYQRRDMTAEE